MTSKGNIYAHARRQAWERFASRLSGDESGLALVVYTEPLEEAARDALEKSFAAIGMGAAGTYADVSGLAGEEVFCLVESLDPIALVAADEAAAQLCSQAVRQPFPPLRKMRLFGREARAFPRLNGLFATESDKQAVWRLLKTLRG